MAKGPTVKTKFTAVDKVTKVTQKISGSVGKLAAVAGSVFVTGKLAQGMGKFISEASKIEDATAGFTPLMGGVKKAEELVGALNKTAASTPFQFENISAAAKQLLPVMNQDIGKTVESFRMLGDTAGGNAQKLETITRGYTKAMLKGKVDMESLNMIAEAGVPIYSELADSMGVSVAEMMKMSSAGKISSDDLTNAFKKMTSEGGIFFEGMEVASRTQTGLWSTLKDNVNLAAAGIGKGILPITKEYTKQAIELASRIREWAEANQGIITQKLQDSIQKIVNVVQTLIKLWNNGLIPALIAFGTTMAVVQKAILIWKAYKAATEAATIAQIAMNAASKAFTKSNLIILAISAIIAVIVLLVKNWDKVKAAMSAVWDLMKSFAAWVADKFLAVVDRIAAGVGAVKDFFGGGGLTGQSNNPYERAGLVGRNDGTLSRSESRSTVDVNLNNMPAGSSVRQKGTAPGVNLNYGYAS